MSILRRNFTPAKTRTRKSQNYAGSRTGRLDEKSARNVLHSGKNWKAYEELLRKTHPPAAQATPDAAAPAADPAPEASPAPKTITVAGPPTEGKPKARKKAAAPKSRQAKGKTKD